MNVAGRVEGTGDALNNVDKNLIPPPPICARSVQHRLDDASRSLGNREHQTRLVLLQGSTRDVLVRKSQEREVSVCCRTSPCLGCQMSSDRSDEVWQTTEGGALHTRDIALGSCH